MANTMGERSDRRTRRLLLIPLVFPWMANIVRQDAHTG